MLDASDHCSHLRELRYHLPIKFFFLHAILDGMSASWSGSMRYCMFQWKTREGYRATGIPQPVFNWLLPDYPVATRAHHLHIPLAIHPAASSNLLTNRAHHPRHPLLQHPPPHPILCFRLTHTSPSSSTPLPLPPFLTSVSQIFNR